MDLLQNAEERRDSYRATFEIPSLELRQGLKVGDWAKLIFNVPPEDRDWDGGPAVERMWVRVTERISGRYAGILDNHPAYIHPARLFVGVVIKFGPEHVCQIQTYTGPRWQP